MAALQNTVAAATAPLQNVRVTENIELQNSVEGNTASAQHPINYA